MVLDLSNFKDKIMIVVTRKIARKGDVMIGIRYRLLCMLVMCLSALVIVEIESTSEKVDGLHEKTYTVDQFIFAFDRPLQLESLLRSGEKYITGLGETFVLYRSSDDQFDAAFDAVKALYPHVNFVKQNRHDPYGCFKKLFLECIFERSKSDYMFIGVDDIIVTNYVDVSACARDLETFNAYGFYLRLGKNIRQCYTLSIEQDFPLPDPLEEVKPGIFRWVFKQGHYDWNFPHSADMTVFKKSDVRQALYEMDYCTPNSLDRVWDAYAHHNGVRDRYALCFDHSKMINIPLNIVQENKRDRNMGFFSTADLLEEFNAGFKIDIDDVYQFENKAPHVHYVPKFIKK